MRCVSFILSTVMRLLCGKRTSFATIYIWIKSENIQDYFKDFVNCFSITVKKEKEEKEGGGHCWKVCKTGVSPSASILKPLK